MSELNRTHTSAPDDRLPESAVLAELMQLRSVSHEQVERIHQLEQALDQSLESIADLRRRIVDQEFLEAQLAATEEIANVQQQAIVRLKLQLEQKPLEPAAATNRSLQNLMESMEVFAKAQQAELQKLRSRLVHDRAELQRQQKQWGSAGKIDRSVPPSVPSPTPNSAAPISLVPCKVIEDLESPNLTTQALLQHTCQELEAERDRQQSRIVDLENQTAEMQEQILRQAQHITEQETAVQHWKDRYLNHQQQTQRLAALLQAVALPPGATEILTALQANPQPPIDPALSLVVPDRQNVQLDLPEFLMRRRSYAPRRASPAD